MGTYRYTIIYTKLPNLAVFVGVSCTFINCYINNCYNILLFVQFLVLY